MQTNTYQQKFKNHILLKTLTPENNQQNLELGLSEWAAKSFCSYSNRGLYAWDIVGDFSYQVETVESI